MSDSDDSFDKVSLSEIPIDFPEEMTETEPRKRYAILLEAKRGWKAPSSFWEGAKAIFTGKEYEQANVISGRLLEILEDTEVGLLADYFEPPPNYKVMSDPSIIVYCKPMWVKELTDKQVKFLQAVKFYIDRIKALPKLTWIESLREGSGAYVCVPPTFDCPTRVTIQYIGKIPVEGVEGIHFGVELLEKRYFGTTNGSYGNYQLFECPDKCGLFVSMDKLSVHDSSSTEVVQQVNELTVITREPSVNDDKPKSFNIGDRVLVYDVKQNSVKATVKWIGKNEKALPRVVIVGVYTDHMIFESKTRFPKQIASMDHLISPTVKHTRLFLPIYLVEKDTTNSEARHGHNTRFSQDNSSFNQPTYTEKAKWQDTAPTAYKPSQIEESKKRNQEAQKVIEQDEYERQQQVESSKRRNQQLQIKEKLQIKEIKGFDDTMLDPDTQKQIWEKIKDQKGSHHEAKQNVHGENSGNLSTQQVAPLDRNYHYHHSVDQPMDQHSQFRQPMDQHDQPMDQRNQSNDQRNQSMGQRNLPINQHHQPVNQPRHHMDNQQPVNHFHQPINHPHQPMGQSQLPVSQPINQGYQHHLYSNMQVPHHDRCMAIGSSDYYVSGNNQAYSGGGGHLQQQGHTNAPYQPPHQIDQHPVGNVTTPYQPPHQINQHPVGNVNAPYQPPHQIDQHHAVRLQQQSSSQQESDFNNILRAEEGPPISMGDGRLPQDHPYSSQHYRGGTGLRQEEGSTKPPLLIEGFSETRGFNQPPHEGIRYKLEVGDAVQSNSNPHHYGTIQFIGELRGAVGLIAGVEMEDNIPGATDGWHDGYKYFQCKPGRGVFIRLDALQPDPRFIEHGKHLDNVPNPLGPFHWNDNSGKETFAMPPVKIIEYIHTGIKKGIQGHQNSCYLDSTLFGLFAYSTVFDDLFLKDSPDEIGKIIKRTLLIIVNKLRQDYVIHFEAIMVLRNELDKLQQVKGLKSEEKDPEEFLNLLFKHVLNVEPFLMIKRPFGTDKEFFVQLFMEPDANRIPGTQELLCGMFKEQQITFKKHPLRLLLQIPRYGKQFKSFRGVIPSLELDVTTLCEGYVAVAAKVYPCFVCNKPGVVMCEDCGKEELKPKPYFYCQDCTTLWHGNPNRQHHKPLIIQPGNDAGNDDTGNDVGRLRLLSVLCIETSHYVCFTRLEGSGTNEWVFFDSMAERPDDVHNLPQVTNCTTELNEWVYGTKDLARYTSKELPTLVRRFVEDAYLCIYVDHDGIMYGGDDA